MRWVTRQSIRVNRTATCWLVRRLLDPEVEFIFVPPGEVAAVQAERASFLYDALYASLRESEQ
jgi:hypothetical protein